MQKSISIIIFFPILLAIIISAIIIPHVANSIEQTGVEVILESSSHSLYLSEVSWSESSSDFYWPIPGCKIITSYFGYRKAPAGGASTYHGGIDIGATQGSKIFAIQSGEVSFVGWNGANGYTVMINHGNNVVSTYGHVNPKFIVKQGDYVVKGEHIANVGPKYVEEKTYTKYKDSSGKPTNGATTGPHLHFAISINGKKVDPLTLFNI